jgi:hypothetical protein
MANWIFQGSQSLLPLFNTDKTCLLHSIPLIVSHEPKDPDFQVMRLVVLRMLLFGYWRLLPTCLSADQSKLSIDHVVSRSVQSIALYCNLFVHLKIRACYIQLDLSAVSCPTA